MHMFNKGFTLLEVLVVITILLVIATFSMFAIQNYAHQQQLQAAEQTLTTAFREARQKTVAAESDTNFGLLFSTSTVVRYEGQDSTVAPESYETIDMTNVTLSAVFSDGSNEISFARLTGRPSATGTIMLQSMQTTAERLFYVTDTGLLLPHD